MVARTCLLVALLVAVALSGCTQTPVAEETSCEADPSLPDCAPPPLPPAPTNNTVPEQVPDLPHHPNDGAVEITNITIANGEHAIPATVYKPDVAGPNATVPILLHSHGWAGARISEGGFAPFIEAGFGVLSYDQRGHGDASGTSVARVMHMEYEIRDAQRIIDEVATWDWVHLDAPGDPRIGAIGGSYGGAYQLLTAAVDDRLDAIAPEMTWHSLPQSLVPNMVPKSAWLDLLYLGARASGTAVSDEIHQGYASVQATNTMPDGKEPGEPDLLTPFSASSPAAYPGAIDIPTLIIQGTSDTLFNFNEAAANYDMIAATGAPVRFITHLDGHIINTQGTVPGSTPIPVGLQPAAGGDPCGDPDLLAVAWFEEHLIGIPSESLSRVCFAMEDGRIIVGEDYPLPGTTLLEFDVGELTLPMGGHASTVELPLLEAPGEMVLNGIGRLTGELSSAAPDAIVFWTLEVISGDERRIVNSQVTPLRLAGDATVDLELGGVGTVLEAGDTLVLVARDRNEQFAHNDNRVPGLVTGTALKLTLPTIDAALLQEGLEPADS